MRLPLILLIFLAGSLQTIAEPYSTFEERGKVGLKNEAGIIIIPASYEALGWSNGSFSITGQVTGYKLRGSWGLLNLNNQRVTPPHYSSLTPAGGLLVASKRSASFKVSTGCISTEGKVVIPFTYTGVTVHSLRAVAFIREGNQFKHGLIDLENKILIPFQYQNIYPIGSLRYAVENFDGKTALFSDGGKQITGFTIDSISHFKNNLAIIYEGGRQGLITREGELKSEAKYRAIRIDQNSISCRLPDEWIVLDGQNKQAEKIGADSVVSLGEGRYKIEDAQSVRLVDEAFKSINAEVFQSIEHFQHGLSIFKLQNQYGVVKKSGEIVLRPLFQKIIMEKDYMLTLEKTADKPSWSLRDTLGQKQNSKTYDLIHPKQQTIFPVIKNGYWGAIDARGAEIVACVYDSILELNANQLAVKFRGQYGIISLMEEWLAFPQKHKIKLLNQDRYFLKRDNSIFLCSFNGTILYFTINPIEVEKDHLLETVSTGGTWTIDFDGRIINRQLPPAEPTEYIFPSTEGLRGIQKNGKFGFIDDQGRLRIANRYEGIKPFTEGLAAIKIRNKWGFINRDETIMIHPNYEDVTPFNKGYSIIKQKGFYGLLTREGKVILPARYDAVTFLDNGRFLLSLNGLHGLADQQGNVLLHPKYNSITDLDNGYVIIEQEGKFGLVTHNGLSTIPLMYDYLKYDAEKNRYLALKKSQWITLQ
jgi:hypothetical protein